MKNYFMPELTPTDPTIPAKKSTTADPYKPEISTDNEAQSPYEDLIVTEPELPVVPTEPQVTPEVSAGE